MTTPIEFWFDFSSPYAYFAAFTVEDRIAHFGRPIVWRPFLLGAVFKITGMGSLSRTPMRGDYARRDWTRISLMLNRPFNLPQSHPYRSQCVARAFYWLEENERSLAVPFAKRAFQTYFEHGLDLTNPEACRDLLRGLNYTSTAFDSWLESETAKQLLRHKTAEAIEKCVFGSPFFIVDNEPFWGWDRIPLLEHWLAHDNGKGGLS